MGAEGPCFSLGARAKVVGVVGHGDTLASRQHHSSIPRWSAATGYAGAPSHKERGAPSSDFSYKSKGKTYLIGQVKRPLILKWISLNKPTPEFQTC